jgi:predicted transcriptional regulator
MGRDHSLILTTRAVRTNKEEKYDMRIDDPAEQNAHEKDGDHQSDIARAQLWHFFILL